MKKSALLLLVLFSLSACSHRNTEKWIAMAESYSELNPDSTLLYLDRIKKTEKLSGRDWARIQLFRTKAEMWKGQKQDSDSIIRKAADLFAEKQDSVYASDAYFRAGLIHYYVGEYLPADSLFKLGLRFAITPAIRVPLYEAGGYNYLYLHKQEEALEYHREAMKDFELVHSRWKPFLLADMGQAHGYLGQTDSAIWYYKKAIEEATHSNRAGLASFYYTKITNLYKEAGQYNNAIETVKKSIHFRNTRQSIPLHMLTYAKIFLAAGETDSAYIYLQKAIQSPDALIASRAYQYMAEMYEVLDRDSISFTKWDTYRQSFENTRNDIDREIVQRQFQDEKLRNENNELKLKQKQKDIYLLSLSLVLIIVCALAYIIYSKEKKKKIVAQLEQERELIALREKTTALREQLFRKLSVSQKIPSLSGKQKETDADINSRLTPEDMEELMQTVDSIWPGFAGRLQSTYPLLKPKDITFCCLLKSGISVKDLAAIYYVTISAISQKKARMKRDKFGIQDEAVSLDDILNSF